MASTQRSFWPNHQVVILDCDSTQVTVEGIDELARIIEAETTGQRADEQTGMAIKIAALAKRAMEGELPLEEDYPNLIACRINWEGGHRTVAGVLFGNGVARLVQYDRFQVDAYPDGCVLILENEDVPGVIGQVGTRLGKAGINIAQWRYGRDHPGGKAVSFINLDQQPRSSILRDLEQETEIYRARLVRL
jgi:ACT domain